MEVFVLSDRGEVIENGLKLVFLHAVPNHNQLFHEQEHERADAQDFGVGGTGPVCNRKRKRKSWAIEIQTWVLQTFFKVIQAIEIELRKLKENERR